MCFDPYGLYTPLVCWTFRMTNLEFSIGYLQLITICFHVRNKAGVAGLDYVNQRIFTFGDTKMNDCNVIRNIFQFGCYVNLNRYPMVIVRWTLCCHCLGRRCCTDRNTVIPTDLIFTNFILSTGKNRM